MSNGSGIALHGIADFVRGYEEEKRLLGYRSGCGFLTASFVLVCPSCGERDITEVELSGRGRIVALSIQHFPGDQFFHDAPYAYVVVALDEGGRITGWMPSVRTEAGASIGDRVHFSPGYRSGVVFEKDEPPGSG